jgi:hypothetical protein
LSPRASLDALEKIKNDPYGEFNHDFFVVQPVALSLCHLCQEIEKCKSVHIPKLEESDNYEGESKIICNIATYCAVGYTAGWT